MRVSLCFCCALVFERVCRVLQDRAMYVLGVVVQRILLRARSLVKGCEKLKHQVFRVRLSII